MDGLASSNPSNGMFRERLAYFCDEHERVVKDHFHVQQLLREWLVEISCGTAETKTLVLESETTYEEDVPAEREAQGQHNASFTLGGFTKHSSSAMPSPLQAVEEPSIPWSEPNSNFQNAAEPDLENYVLDFPILLHGSTRGSTQMTNGMSTSNGDPISASWDKADDIEQSRSSATLSGIPHLNERRILATSDLRDLMAAEKPRLIAGRTASLNRIAASSNNSPRRFAALIVSHRFFEHCVAFIIVLNVLYMGWQTNYTVLHYEEPHSVPMAIISLAFCCFYTVELVLRLLASGWWFLRKPDRNWNIFDGILVLQGLSEQLFLWFGFEDQSRGGFSFLRAIRLGKLVKMLRVIRLMRSMREMRLILFSIMGSISGMFWSCLMIAAVLYMFALIFVQACGEYLKQEGKHVDPAVKRDIVYYWGSVEEAMVSLFIASTGGDDWVRLARPLQHAGDLYYAFFCLYIAFFLFVLMNTITALFVESTFTTATRDHQFTIQSVMEKKADYVQSLKMLFHEADTDGDGVISLEEFCSRLDDPKMRAFAESLHIEVGDAEGFFMLLTDGGRSPIDLESFVMSCIRMRGQALAIDVQDLLMRQKLADSRSEVRMKKLSRQLEKVEQVSNEVAKAMKMLQVLQSNEQSRVNSMSPTRTRDFSVNGSLYGSVHGSVHGRNLHESYVVHASTMNASSRSGVRS